MKFNTPIFKEIQAQVKQEFPDLNKRERHKVEGLYVRQCQLKMVNDLSDWQKREIAALDWALDVICDVQNTIAQRRHSAEYGRDSDIRGAANA